MTHQQLTENSSKEQNIQIALPDNTAGDRPNVSVVSLVIFNIGSSVTDSQIIDVIILAGARHDIIKNDLVDRIMRLLFLQSDKLGITSKMLQTLFDDNLTKPCLEIAPSTEA